MLLQRLRWILPVLIVSWTSLQLGEALPARDERSHVSANTFHPSATTSTMIRQDYNKRAPDGKNNTQSSYKLVASPAGLLRPDKFQFYTYNDKGDMITRQMTAQEIQGLIAAGGADHVAMDRQEPQKADDVLTGGKKVMDVVQKVQNVLKSALDKPPTLTGTLPKIPEHANVEWSNILPSILSGETDAISLNSESNQLSHKLTTEKVEVGSSVVSSIESAMNIGAGATLKYPTKRPITSDIQTNAYAGFTNNMQPQHGHHSQQTPAVGATSEKPMIPVPVITLTEQKLSTLQSAITESPVFQMLSVIPVESAHKGGQTDSSTADTASSTTAQLPTQTEELGQTEQFVELTLSEVPEETTFSQLTSVSMHPVTITKHTTTSLDNKTDQGMTIYYSMTSPDTSIDSSTVDTKQTVMHDDDKSVMNTSDRIASSNVSYILIQNENNTKASEEPSFVPGVMKEPQVNGTYNDDKTISQTNKTTTLGPLSHASPHVSQKPNELSNATPLHLPSTFASTLRIQTSTVPTLLHMDHLNEHSSMVTKESSSSVTSTYVENHLNPLPTKIQSLTPIESLSTHLIDSLSSVMNQVSEVRPSVLSLSSPSDETPNISIVKINYNEKYNMSQTDKFPASNVDTQDIYLSHDANEENVERIVSPQTYTTVTTEVSSQNGTTKITDYSITQRPVSTIATNKESTTINDVSANSRVPAITSTTIQGTSSAITTNNLATITARPTVESTAFGTTISESTAFSPVRVKPEIIYNTLPGNQIKTPTILEITTATNAERHTTEKITSFEQISPIASTILDAPKIQSTTASIDTNESLNKPAPTKETFDNLLANLNLSDPVSAIDQVLNIVSLPSNTPTIEPISFPSNALNLVTNNLASGLIAGFTTSTPSVKETNENQISKITSSGHTVRPTVSSNVTKMEFIENTTQIYKDTIKFNVNDQKKNNVTQAPTQETLTTQTGNDMIIMQTKDSNYTLEAAKLPNSNERLDDQTKVSSSLSPNKFVNISDELRDSTGQSAITEGTVTVNSEQSSTMNADIQLYVNKTLPDTRNKTKTENKEKVKLTEASNIKTDVRPVLSQLPAKISSINSTYANDTRNAVNVSINMENNLRTDTLGKNESFPNASPLSKENVTISANDFNSKLDNSYEYNITTDTAVPNVTFSTAITSEENSTSPTLSHNPHVVNDTTNYKNEDNVNSVQSNKNNYNNYSSLPTSPSIQEHVNAKNPIVEVVTEKLSGDTNGNKQESSQQTLVNSTNDLKIANKTSNQNNKDMAHTVSTVNANVSSVLKNASMQTVGHSDNVESKPASLKHSEDPPKLEVIRLQSSTPPPSSVPVRQTSKPTIGHKPLEKSDVPKVDAEVSTEDKWTLISQQTSPTVTKHPKPPKPSKPPRKPINHVQTTPSNSDENVRLPETETTGHQQNQHDSSMQSVLPLDASQSASGLDVTIRHTSADIVNFAKLCNELAFNFWVATNKGLSTARSLALSPFGMTSLLAMIFLGARGPTSDQMNEVLGLDDVATFNPHLVFQNITDTVSLARGQGIANAAFVRELFADKMKVRKLMPFYKEQAQQFYEGLVAEVNFATISDLVRRRTNLLIRKQTGGRIKDFVKTNTVPLRSPLAALSANVFQTDCNSSLTSSVGRDGELYFAVSPAVRQRKLIPVPATTWRSGVLAGYEPSIDATAVALGTSDRLVSTIFVLPGQQGHTAPGDTLDRLEQRLVRSAFRDGAWNKLLKVLIPRSGLELQVPKFSHRSVVNATAALKRMGLDELFSGNADFKGINGVGHRLYLADVLQMNLFSTCGDENILGGRHHVETYPASPIRRSIRRRMENTDNFGNVAEEDTSRRISASSQEDYVNSFYRSRTGRFYREKRQLSGSSERPRLKLDRPFLYFVRHNPSGIILHMGRFNPRLLP